MKRFQLIVCLFLLAGLILVNQRFEPEDSVLYGGLTWLGWAGVFLFLLGIAFVIAAEDFIENLIFFFRGKVDAKAVQKPRELSPEELAELGLKKYHGPDFPHPVIFTERCIGCQACVDACPHDVLAIVGGVAATVAEDQCMEDTACQVECPVNPKACIDLNTTKEIRSRPSPNRDGSNYQTNVPGCYIIGDVSGVPLIKNAVKEGAEVIEHIAADLRPSESKAQYDVAIIGIGPGGASAAMAAHEKGLRYIAIEQEKTLSTIEMYPKGKYIFFKPDTKDWFGALKAVGLGLVKGKYESAVPAPATSLPAEFEKHIKDAVDSICGELSLEIPKSLHAEFLPLLEEKVKTEVTRRLENESTANRAGAFAKLRTEISDDLKTKIPGDQRERILSVWLGNLHEKGVKINEQESCKSVKRADDGDHFVIETEQGNSKTPCVYTARRVILAIGLRGAPNRLRLPNEEMKININGREENKVLYALSNPGDYRGKNLIVVGGGNSAVEAAVDLVVKRDGSNITPRPPEEMNRVTLLVRSYLAPTVKFGNKYQLYQMFDSGILDVKFGAAIKEMSENEVVLMNVQTNEEIDRIPNDYIFALVGGERPDRFLKSIGIEIS
jgi:thioredoxin reductase/ferredoxin-like protein FixX